MTDLISYYLHMAASSEAYALASRMDAVAASVDPRGDEGRAERVEGYWAHARAYEDSARTYRRLAAEAEERAKQTAADSISPAA